MIEFKKHSAENDQNRHRQHQKKQCNSGEGVRWGLRRDTEEKCYFQIYVQLGGSKCLNILKAFKENLAVQPPSRGWKSKAPLAPGWGVAPGPMSQPGFREGQSSRPLSPGGCNEWSSEKTLETIKGFL